MNPTFNRSVFKIVALDQGRKFSFQIWSLELSFKRIEGSQMQLQKIMIRSLTLTHPIGLPPHASVAQKIADQRWLIANSAKIGTIFFYISFVRVSYKIIWLKTWSCYKNPLKMKARRAQILIFQKMHIKNLRWSQWGKI